MGQPDAVSSYFRGECTLPLVPFQFEIPCRGRVCGTDVTHDDAHAHLSIFQDINLSGQLDALVIRLLGWANFESCCVGFDEMARLVEPESLRFAGFKFSIRSLGAA